MKIIIMRHAKVLMVKRTIYANELKSCIEAYDISPIDKNIPNPKELLALVDSCDYFVSSGLFRSVETLNLLGKKPDIIDEIFQEVESPYTTKKIIKLPLYTWGALFKIAWFFGFSNGSKSYKESKQDAQRASNILIDFAQKKGTVLLVGHGIMNHLIAKVLMKKAWKESKKMHSSNWDYGVYEFHSML